VFQQDLENPVLPALPQCLMVQEIHWSLDFRSFLTDQALQLVQVDQAVRCYQLSQVDQQVQESLMYQLRQDYRQGLPGLLGPLLHLALVPQCCHPVQVGRVNLLIPTDLTVQVHLEVLEVLVTRYFRLVL